MKTYRIKKGTGKTQLLVKVSRPNIWCGVNVEHIGTFSTRRTPANEPADAKTRNFPRQLCRILTNAFR